ncbi:energy-coupled thiamine transporter ThiT [Virgibacillus proomii]|uniref:energy-coupled thiamine transporter ThiT n=1 Tax=Virgibacillus proomii TaxID=84407 RepID=UPI0015C2FB66
MSCLFESAIKGQSVWFYSLIYNDFYMIPAFLLSAAVIILLFHNQPRALLQKSGS